MPNALPLFKLKRSTPDWPVDLLALLRATPRGDLNFRFFVAAQALQNQGIPAKAVVCDLHFSIFNGDEPIHARDHQTWPWSLASRRSCPEPGLRLGNQLWTMAGARRWEDALLHRHEALADALLPNQLADMSLGEETALEAPPYKPWTDQKVNQALESIGAVAMRQPKPLELEAAPAPPNVLLVQADQALTDQIEGRGQPLTAPILPPGFFDSMDWLVMGQSSEREGALAFFQWGDPAKRAALEQQWMDRRLEHEPEAVPAPSGRRMRL